jgi:hypothetical protein
MNDLPPGDVVQVSQAMFLAGQEGRRAPERQSVNLTGRVSVGGVIRDTAIRLAAAHRDGDLQVTRRSMVPVPGVRSRIPVS